MNAATILIVEDEWVVAKDLEDRLRSLCYEVPAKVSRGEDAIEQALALRPSLILMDIKLGKGMDGITAAERICARINLPIVYVTASADLPILERARLTEPYGYIHKPFDTKALYTTIELALHRHASARRLALHASACARVVEAMADAVIVIDDKARVIHLNGAAEALTGWSAAAACGRSAAEVVRTSGKGCMAALRHALGGSAVPAIADTGAMIARDGSQVRIFASALPFRDRAGVVAGAALVAHATGPVELALDGPDESLPREARDPPMLLRMPS
jgi:PAS domain S-box-containing protein